MDGLIARQELIAAIAEAIAHEEGYYVVGSLARRNNNPGNLRPWRACAYPISKGFIRFTTADDGWEHLHKQVDLNIRRGLTLYEFFGGKPHVYAGYAPSTDNNKPVQYAEHVAARISAYFAIEIKPDVVLAELAPIEPKEA